MENNFLGGIAVNISEINNSMSGYVSMIAHTGKYNYDTDEIENGKILSSRSFKNLIVNTSAAILSSSILPNNNMSIQYLAVGVGYNDGRIPNEDIERESLIHEVARVKIGRYGYITKDGKKTSIQKPSTVAGCVLKATISNVSQYDLVEMGLFGGSQETSDTSISGIMYNYKTFSTWNISEDASLTIIWRLYFR